MEYRFFLVASWLAFALMPAGCGFNEAADAASKAAADKLAAARKLAARVNGTEISLQQIAGTRGNPLQALDKVIDRELLVQQALEAKLDTDPEVAQAIDSARRQVLAQAYLERAAAAKAKSSPDEVSAFYAENPALFAQRRIYRLREVSVVASADKLDLIRSELIGARDLDEIVAWLKWRNLKVGAATTSTQPAEQLPLSYLPQISRMKEGELAVFSSALGASVVQLVQAQDAPLTEQQAAPLIEQFLAGRKRLELAAAEVKRLRQLASIEYVGDFKR
jgi:EpsD family peptidyl-prolyl cis-trans isomerase